MKAVDKTANQIIKLVLREQAMKGQVETETVSEVLSKFLADNAEDFYEKDKCVVIWGIEDIKNRAQENYGHDVVISDKLALQIIEKMQHNHDCNHGITWETIDYYLNESIK